PDRGREPAGPRARRPRRPHATRHYPASRVGPPPAGRRSRSAPDPRRLYQGRLQGLSPVRRCGEGEDAVMPLTGYGVLAGQVTDSRAEGGTDSPHLQIRVRGGDTDFRVAVNVLSQESPSELLFLADESFSHPLVQALPDLPDGFTAVPSQAGGLALDFIRGNLFDP